MLRTSKKKALSAQKQKLKTKISSLEESNFLQRLRREAYASRGIVATDFYKNNFAGKSAAGVFNFGADIFAKFFRKQLVVQFDLEGSKLSLENLQSDESLQRILFVG